MPVYDPVYSDMPRACTLNEEGERKVKVRSTGYEKQRVIVMFRISVDSLKFAPHIIIKRRTLPKNETFPKDAIERILEKGEVTRELMPYWMKII